MTITHRYRIGLTAVAVATGLMTGGVLGMDTATATATARPNLVVTPVSGLHNGQKVKVTGTGFKAHDHVYIVECLAKASGQAQCATTTAIPVTITAKGVLPRTLFTVVTGKVGNGACGTKVSNLNNCAVSVGNVTGGDSAVARIAFKRPTG